MTRERDDSEKNSSYAAQFSLLLIASTMTKNDVKLFQVIGLLLSCCMAKTVAFFSTPYLAREWRSNLYSQSHLQTQDLHLEELKDDAKFLRNCQVDVTIRNLRKQLPRLLLEPLNNEDVERIYSEDVSLIGPGGEELAFGQEELVALSSTLVAATAAARQANAFASSFTMTNATIFNDTVQCEMAIDDNLETLRVGWRVDLGQQGSGLMGLSDLILNEGGKVCQHKVLDVKLDGQTVSAVGETLATLRRAFRTFGDSPLLTGLRESPFAATLLEDIRNGLIQQQQQQKIETLPVPPLYVTDSVCSAFASKNSNNMTLIDNLDSALPPLPGSLRWTDFAASRQGIAQFVECGLPVLTGNVFSTKDDFTKLFATNAELKGVDGVVLASGGDRVANFYRTLASLRKGTSGDWKISHVSTDYNSRSVIVNWIATIPIRVEGKDRFQLSCDGEEDSVIESIEQLELKISGNRVKDPEWFRTFLSTIETGKGNVGVEMVVDLLQQAGGSQLRKTPKILKGPPKLKPEAAASFYGILCALHRDLPTLMDANPQSPPAAEYVADSVELRGYLDELLAKGFTSYSQVANVLTGSLRAALRTGRVTAEAPPSPTIEFTADGSIRVSLFIKLKVKVAPRETDLGVPLNLELVSEYKVNSDGEIKEHKLIESRVNGQLTAGDVISRWIKGTAIDDPSPSAPLLDILAWARSLSGSKRQ